MVLIRFVIELEYNGKKAIDDGDSRIVKADIFGPFVVRLDENIVKTLEEFNRLLHLEPTIKKYEYLKGYIN